MEKWGGIICHILSSADLVVKGIEPENYLQYAILILMYSHM